MNYRLIAGFLFDFIVPFLISCDKDDDSPEDTLNLSISGLENLGDDFQYEGWLIADGNPVTTGTFSDPSEVDDAAPFSGNMSGPPFPGEDFIVNAPGGLSFPTDLPGGIAVISVEPVPDNSPAPFLLKPLVDMIPSDAEDHVVYDMNQNLSFPSGTASR